MDKKTPGALLKLGIGEKKLIVERRRESDVTSDANETPLFNFFSPDLPILVGTVLGGQFNWGGSLLKGNGGAQRSASSGWKSEVKCKRISWLNCESDHSSPRRFSRGSDIER